MSLDSSLMRERELCDAVTMQSIRLKEAAGLTRLKKGVSASEKFAGLAIHKGLGAHRSPLGSLLELDGVSTSSCSSRQSFLRLLPCECAGELVNLQLPREVHSASQLRFLTEDDCQNLQEARLDPTQS